MGTVARAAMLMLLTLTLLAWVAVCAGAFWFVYSGIIAANPDNTISALQWLAWPITTIVIAVPLLLVLAFGGLRTVVALLELIKQAKELTSEFDKLQGLLSALETTKSALAATRTDLALNATAGDTEQATAVDAESGQEEGGAGQEQPSYVNRFYALYATAKREFKQGVRHYLERNPDSTELEGLNDWIAIIKKLTALKGNYFDEGERKDKWAADWLIEVIEAERKTRKDRAGRLSETEVAGYEERMPSAYK